ncbi:MAG: flagellar motor switch protein FliG [Sphingomonadaceae bacterium]
MTVPILASADDAAVMVMLLSDEDASALLEQMSAEELRLLGSHMCGLGDIAPQVIASAIARFASTADQQGLEEFGRHEHVRRVMRSAVGEVRAENLMRRIAPESADKVSTLDLVRWLEPDVLITLVEDEHPQAIAVLMLQLDREIAAEVLAGLPEKLQLQVVHRIATLGPVSPDALSMLEETLIARIEDVHGARPFAMGGIAEAAEIINKSARTVSDRLMPQLGRLDKKLSRAIEDEMFKFEHLIALDTQMMGALLREVDSETLIDALKGLEPDQCAPFFGAMSSRAADGVRDEIEARGRLKKEQVDAAQRDIVTIARRLVGEGVISLGKSDGDYV